MRLSADAPEVPLPPFSVTSTLPSIMNGGKDFSDWSKRDDLLYKTLRIPVESVWQTAPLLRASSKRERILRRVC